MTETTKGMMNLEDYGKMIEQESKTTLTQPLKMGDKLAALLKEGVERVAKMSKEERKAMHESQSESWARQDND